MRSTSRDVFKTFTYSQHARILHPSEGLRDGRPSLWWSGVAGHPHNTLLPRPSSHVTSGCSSSSFHRLLYYYLQCLPATKQPIHFSEIEDLVDQLPSPFIVMGDFNAHSLLWGSQDVNSRGKTVERLLTELDLALLNDGSPTYFHSPTQSFTAIDLSICSIRSHLGCFWKPFR